MVKSKKTLKIKTATVVTIPGLGEKSRQDLVDEANSRRQEKIQAAKEREAKKQESLREQRERKAAKKREEDERQKEKKEEEAMQQEKLKAARQREKQTTSMMTTKTTMTMTKPTMTDMETEPPPKKYKVNKNYQSKISNAHRDQTLNEWEPANMKAAIERYHAQQLHDWPAVHPKLSIR